MCRLRARIRAIREFYSMSLTVDRAESSSETTLCPPGGHFVVAVMGDTPAVGRRAVRTRAFARARALAMA